jgi:ATP-binding cassette subfamily B protein
MHGVFINLGSIILLMVVLAVVMYVRIYTNNWMGANIIKDLRNDMYGKIQMLNYSFLDTNMVGDLMARNTADINLLKQLMSSQLAMFVRQALTFVFAIVAMYIINPTLSLYIIAALPFVFIVMMFYRKKIYPVMGDSRESNSDLTSVVKENISGMRVVRAFAMEDFEIAKFNDINTEYYKANMGLIKWSTSFEPLVRLLINIAIVLLIYEGGRMASLGIGNIQVGDFFALILLADFSIEPLFFISKFLGDMSKISVTCDRVVEVLNSDQIIPNADNPEIKKINGEIRFKDVWFSYEHDEHYVLKGVDFKIEPGENIAILGATGSGKSTLIKLISRFYEIDKGAITIDGIDIKQWDQHALRSQIGYVSQEVFLFSRSIRDNIALGHPEIPLEDIQEAAKLANIHDFIDLLPDGYDTIVGERGVTLSGGQKQRIAIARALVIKPRIIVFDDATSAVDVDTEFQIQKSFGTMFKGSTSILITQRLSTIRHADRIFVLDHGKISQMGSHEQLVSETQGIYYNLIKTLKAGGVE